MNVDHGNLENTFELRKYSQAFLFEPKDLVPYELAWKWQREWQDILLSHSDGPQAIWLLQHPLCYTLGRGGNESNLRFSSKDPSIDLFRIDRGGEVTCHLPGQLVVYLVIDLRRHKKDLDWYLRKLEAVVLDVLDELGLVGEQLKGLTGVWVQGRKVSSIGVGCRRWITQHGLALNIDCDLKGFNEIIPCGLSGHTIGNLESWLPGIKVGDVQPLMRESIRDHFGLVFDEKQHF